MTEPLKPPPRPPLRLAGSATWAVTWRGLRTVTRLELRQRIRSSRWKPALAIWAYALGGLTVLLFVELRPDRAFNGLHDPHNALGAALFGLTAGLTLTLGALVVPGLAATSINGDRAAGVLDTLRVTPLTPAEIVLGKLAAAWLTSLAFLAVALPFLIGAYATGGNSLARLAVTVLLLAVMFLVISAISVGCSALTARTAPSVALAYLTVGFLGVMLPLLYALGLPQTSTDEPRTVNSLTSTDTVQCLRAQETGKAVRSGRIWWLLAADPFVVLADAPFARDFAYDPATELRLYARHARHGSLNTCLRPGHTYDDHELDGEGNAVENRASANFAPVWPYGLAADLALGAGFVVAAVRRTRTPLRRLPAGHPGVLTVAEHHATSTWAVNRHALGAVVRGELRRRAGSTRWWLVRVTWPVLLGGPAGWLYLKYDLGTAEVGFDPHDYTVGGFIWKSFFALVVGLALILLALVVPALSAPVVAEMAGPLTPAEIVLGRLVAVWLASLAFLAAALPFIIWAAAVSRISLARVAVTVVLLTVTLLVISAVGVGWSALVARTSNAVTLTYLTVAILGVLLPMLYNLALPAVTTYETRTINDFSGNVGDRRCAPVQRTEYVEHTERIWWLLAVNPYVIIADANSWESTDDIFDEFASVRHTVRMAKASPVDGCTRPGHVYTDDEYYAEDPLTRDFHAPVWPYGLAADLTLGGGLVAAGVRRVARVARPV